MFVARRHSGCRLDLIFYNWSAGELSFLVKHTVQCSDELDHEIQTNSSTYYLQENES